jgi:hypothetical protein
MMLCSVFRPGIVLPALAVFFHLRGWGICFASHPHPGVLKELVEGLSYSREHKSISIHPMGIFGVEGHELVEKDMGGGRQAHGSSGMTGVCCEGGIDLYEEFQNVRDAVVTNHPSLRKTTGTRK